jgi:hypothetical protein
LNVEQGFKIIFGKMLKFAGFLGVAHFFDNSLIRIGKCAETAGYHRQPAAILNPGTKYVIFGKT